MEDRRNTREHKGREKDMEKLTPRGTKGGERRKKGKPLTLKGIFNLSKKVLTQVEVKVLEKGLTFAPTNKIDTFGMFIDTEKCIRKLMLKKAFSKNNHIERNYETKSTKENSNYTHAMLKTKSEYIPTQEKGSYIKTYKELVKKDLAQLIERYEKSGQKKGKIILTKNESMALEEIKKRRIPYNQTSR
ncbi:hypothetical protein XELAEV_18037515mg [Xenopus laevis]|uniref:Uncharacterized protein n=1 Tax=Xenopus laevis TaxID=8355 RepID=A0A974HAP2_XENLA|nr:hypothetical protein XELAEV_18037515mg [Xenopus laevis]